MQIELTPLELVTCAYLFRSARRERLQNGPLCIRLDRAEAENGCVIDRNTWESLERKHVIASHMAIGDGEKDVLLFLDPEVGDLLAM